MRGAPSETASAKVGRNEPCPCGSGKKFKQCCEGKDVPEFGLFAGGAPTADQKARLQALHLAAREHAGAGRWDEALKPLLEIARLDPDNAQAHYDLGCVSMRRGLMQSAVDSLERALALKPSRDDALLQLATAFENLPGRETEAAAAYRKLARRVSDPKPRHAHAAKALMLEGRLEEATEQFRRLVALAPKDVHARTALASLLTDRGLFAEAVEEYAATLDACPENFRSLAQVRRMGVADRPLIARMRSVAEQATLAASSRAAVLFGLGKAFDDLGDYAEAIGCYDIANGLRPQWPLFEREAIERRVDALIASFDREALERASHALAISARPGDKPIVIVGMPRSGTTLTEQILSSHPAVGSGGELPFWHDRKAEWGLAVNVLPSSDLLSQAREDYLALLSKVRPNAARVTDKAPTNFLILHLIRIALPEARIVHCRRHPIDTCLSNYFADFGEFHPFSSARDSLVAYYRHYWRLMAHWRAVLPPERFIEVDYERLIANRDAETRRLIAFAGLDWDDACLAPEKNARVIKTASLWQSRQPVYESSIERWRRYEPWLGELRELLPADAAREPDRIG